MTELPADPIGGAWLVREFGLELAGRLPVVSGIGRRRLSSVSDSVVSETFLEVMRPSAETTGHLQFHLRHEVPHFELLAALFAQTGPRFIQEWVQREPTGAYARRASFLYEWLTGDTLEVPARLGGNYAKAVDDTKLVAASPDKVVKVPRWRIDDNLAGTPWFCPTLVKTTALVNAAELDIRSLLNDLSIEFGEDLLLRSAAWITLRESKASFAIEGEADQATRIQRFADVMARRTGEGRIPLDDASLAAIQREILGTRTSLDTFGIRRSPVFVGGIVRYQDVVHYVAPPAEDVPAMLDGLAVFLDRTAGQSPVLRSAVASFGFVYIHPLADANGRVHRFLVNDILRRDGVVPAPLILPVSAAIADHAADRKAYDRVLDSVSQPIMRRIGDRVSFANENTRYPDGILSNFVFDGDDRARPMWRYLNLGDHVIFMAGALRRCLAEQVREESRYLLSHARARAGIKEIVEMPDAAADRVIRSVLDHQGRLTQAIARDYPVLAQDGVWGAVLEAVQAAFRGAALE